MFESHARIAIVLGCLALASGCQEGAPAIAGDAGRGPGADAAIPELPSDGGSGQPDAGSIDGGATLDAGTIGDGEPGAPPHVRELGPGLTAHPLSPTILIDTRGSAACGDIAALSSSHATIKVDLARCGGIVLPEGTGAIALSITTIPRDPADEAELRVGSSRIAIGPGAPATHHVLARLAGSWLVIGSTGAAADVIVEISAAFATEEAGASRVRLLPRPLRALSTIAGEPAAFDGPITPGTDRVIPVGSLALGETGIPTESITGIVGVVHVAPRSDCGANPFRLSIGPARANADERLLTLAGCRSKVAPWSEGIVIGTRDGELAVRLDGAEAHVTIDVIGFLTTKWSGATLLYLPDSTIHLGRDLDGTESLSIPYRGVVGIAGTARAWAGESARLELGSSAATPWTSVELAPDRVDVAWIATSIDADGTLWMKGSAPMRAEVDVDALFAFD